MGNSSDSRKFVGTIPSHTIKIFNNKRLYMGKYYHNKRLYTGKYKLIKCVSCNNLSSKTKGWELRKCLWCSKPLAESDLENKQVTENKRATASDRIGLSKWVVDQLDLETIKEMAGELLKKQYFIDENLFKNHLANMEEGPPLKMGYVFHMRSFN